MVHTVVPSPLGPITLVAHDGGLSALLLQSSKYEAVQGPFGERADDEFDEVQTQLDEYFAGTRTEFDLPLHFVGTAFQCRVWEGLLRIPYGQTRSYGELAAEIGLDPRDVVARGRGGQRAQPDRDRRAVPPRDRRGRVADRVRRRARPQAVPARRTRPRAGRASTCCSEAYGGQPHARSGECSMVRGRRATAR